MNIHALYRRLFRRFRRRRMRRFEESFLSDIPCRVLDVGGTDFNWTLVERRPDLVIVNIRPSDTSRLPGVRFVVADACRLPFADGSFDVFFSNSLVEHLGSDERQVLFAEEGRRVARGYFVQTPNRRFPIEPHMLMPFIHWLPRSWQHRLIRNFTLRGWLERPSREWCRSFLDDLRLLAPAEMGRLFPDGLLLEERLLGVSKSLIAVKTPEPRTSGERP